MEVIRKIDPIKYPLSIAFFYFLIPICRPPLTLKMSPICQHTILGGAQLEYLKYFNNTLILCNPLRTQGTVVAFPLPSVSFIIINVILLRILHYSDVIMSTIASLITSLAVVYSTVYSDADQRKHQSSASLAFVWGIHRDRWIPRTKGQLRGKCFHLMTSSWTSNFLQHLLPFNGN